MRILIFALGLMMMSPIAQAQDRPVVVELFTSQGCSSCPPADALLHELAKDPQVIALALHVDYWDYIGWKDSFADPAYTKRQRAYATAQSERMIYTPQMMLNGTQHVVGNRAADVRALVAQYKAERAILPVVATSGDGQVTITVKPGNARGPFIVHLVSYRPSSEVAIKRGENAGRTISYANVVTQWRSIAEWPGQDTQIFRTNFDNPHAVVLIQRKGHGEIVAAAHVK